MEDKKLREAAENVLRHWQRRSEFLLTAGAAREDYNSVPFRTAFLARVTYRHVGRMRPLSYPLDE